MKVKIDRLGINGEGVTRGSEGSLVDKVGFVRYAIDGEIVDIDVKKNNAKFFEGELKSVLAPSPDRIKPKCSFFGKCGGCDIQHISKDKQLEFKQSLVKDTLKKVGRIDVEVMPIVRCNDWNYRNKMVWPYVDNGKEYVLGMFENSSHKVVDIDTCYISNEILNTVFKITKKYLKLSGYSAYNYKTKTGDIKYVVARVSGDSILITIVAMRKIDLEQYYAIIEKTFKNAGISLIISSNGKDILDGEYYHCFGIESLEIEELGVKFAVDNRGFLQINREVMSKLYSMVLEEIQEGDYVIDAYSGAGLMSSMIARKASEVVGIEINKSASNSAKMLAKSNNITNLKSICGDVKNIIGDYLNNEKIVVVLDPPRSGCDGEVLTKLLDRVQNIKKIIYVSCNPATLARDLSILSTKYEVSKVVPFDMFVQTKHVETLVCLQR